MDWVARSHKCNMSDHPTNQPKYIDSMHGKFRKLKTLTSTAIVYYNKTGKAMSYNQVGKYEKFLFEITARIWRSKHD